MVEAREHGSRKIKLLCSITGVCIISIHIVKSFRRGEGKKCSYQRMFFIVPVLFLLPEFLVHGYMSSSFPSDRTFPQRKRDADSIIYMRLHHEPFLVSRRKKQQHEKRFRGPQSMRLYISAGRFNAQKTKVMMSRNSAAGGTVMQVL